jgi:hypothetical protein
MLGGGAEGMQEQHSRSNNKKSSSSSSSSLSANAAAAADTAGLGGIFALPHLRRLGLAHLPLVTEEPLIKFFRRKGKELTALSLEKMDNVTDACFLALANSAGGPGCALGLKRLQLESLGLGVTDRGLRPLAIKTTGLTGLSLKKMGPRLTSSAILPLLLRSASTLQHVSLVSLRGLNDACFYALVKGRGQSFSQGGSNSGNSGVDGQSPSGSALVSPSNFLPAPSSSLGMSSFPAASASASASASDPSRSLRSLDISFSRGISNAALGYLIDTSPALSKLVVWGCSQLTEKVFEGHARVEAEHNGGNVGQDDLDEEDGDALAKKRCVGCLIRKKLTPFFPSAAHSAAESSSTAGFMPLPLPPLPGEEEEQQQSGAAREKDELFKSKVRPLLPPCTCHWSRLRVYGKSGDVAAEHADVLNLYRSDDSAAGSTAGSSNNNASNSGGLGGLNDGDDASVLVEEGEVEQDDMWREEGRSCFIFEVAKGTSLEGDRLALIC